jgi:hypothetical protein
MLSYWPLKHALHNITITSFIVAGLRGSAERNVDTCIPSAQELGVLAPLRWIPIKFLLCCLESTIRGLAKIPIYLTQSCPG